MNRVLFTTVLRDSSKPEKPLQLSKFHMSREAKINHKNQLRQHSPTTSPYEATSGAVAYELHLCVTQEAAHLLLFGLRVWGLGLGVQGFSV